MAELKISQHMIVAITAWVSRIISAMSQLVCVRILIDSLGIERYSVFSILISLSGWFVLADLGIGVSVQNFISEKRTKRENYSEWVLHGIIIAIVTALFFVGILYIFSNYLGAVLLKEFVFLSIEQKGTIFFCTGMMLVLFNIGNIIYKVWYAEHQGYLANFAPALAALVGLIATYLVSMIECDYFFKLLYVVLAYFLPTLIIASGSLFYWLQKNGYFIQFNPLIVKKILFRARNFFIFGIMATAVLQIDYIIMARMLTAYDIVVYNISTKIFGMIFFIYNAVLSALWPVCAEYLAQKQWDKVLSILRKYLFIGMIFILCATMIVIITMPYLVKLFSSNAKIIIPTSFIVFLGVYNLIRVWTDTFAMILQSMNQLKPFWILVPFQAIFSVSLQYLFAEMYGIYGILYGLIVSYLLTVAWGLPTFLYKIKKSTQIF